MSEIGGGSDDGLTTGGEGTGESTAGGGTGEVTGGSAGETSVTGETGAGKGAETAHGTSEVGKVSAEAVQETGKSGETLSPMEQAQKSVEAFHDMSVKQILSVNEQYMSKEVRERVARGVDGIRAVPHDPAKGRTGGYLFYDGKSTIEVSAIDARQMERSTKHETNHFLSAHREIIVPEPDKKGYTVYQSVGTRQSSWFHSNETGTISGMTTKGRGLNEGLTTMYTNQQLTELSKEKGEAAEREGIYPQATEICKQLESIVGKDAMKEAYYGGNTKALEAKVDELAGERSFDALRDCLDRTLSRDHAERVQAMKEAQDILAKMHEEAEKRK